MLDQQTQTQSSVDALTRIAFSIYGSPGVYALLVGSGLSRSAGIPTGWEVTLDLVRRLAIAQGESPQPDWAAWYRAKFDKEPNYSELVADLASSPASAKPYCMATSSRPARTVRRVAKFRPPDTLGLRTLRMTATSA